MIELNNCILQQVYKSAIHSARLSSLFCIALNVALHCIFMFFWKSGTELEEQDFDEDFEEQDRFSKNTNFLDVRFYIIEPCGSS